MSSEFVLCGAKEAVIARLFLETVIAVLHRLDKKRVVTDPAGRQYSVLVMQGPAPSMLPTLVSIAQQLMDSTTQQKEELKTFYQVHPALEWGEDMMSILQPVLARDNWDWHGATASRAILQAAARILHVNCPAEYADGSQNSLASWIRACTLEGSPRGHPNNVYIRYIAAQDLYVQLDTMVSLWSEKARETFERLGKVDQIPTRSTTPDAVATVHGVQVATVECKAQFDAKFAGEEMQAIVMCDTFSWTNFDECIGLHSTPCNFRIQRLKYDASNLESHTMSHSILKSFAFDVTQDPVKTPAAATLPVVTYTDVDGKHYSLPVRDKIQKQWSSLKPWLKAYCLGLFQTTCALVEEFRNLRLHEPAVRDQIKAGFETQWRTENAQIPHQQRQLKPIPPTLQKKLYINADFKRAFGDPVNATDQDESPQPIPRPAEPVPALQGPTPGPLK